MRAGTSQCAREPEFAHRQLRALLLISAALALLLPACSRCPSSSSPCGDVCLAAGSTCGGCSSACSSDTICASGQCVGTQVTPLSYQVNDAKYSRGLDRIVMVSYTDLAVHLFDPRANADTAIPLPSGLPQYQGTYVGLYVALSPDGLKAVVTDISWVVYLDLAAATVLGQWEAPSSVIGAGFYFDGVVIAADGYAYASNGGYLTAVNPSTGSFGLTKLIVGSSNDYLTFTTSSDGTYVYALTGVDEFLLSSARPLGGYFGDVAQSATTTCGEPWVSRDGTRVFTGCGNTFGPAVATTDGGTVPAGHVLQVAPAQPETDDGGDAPFYDPPIYGLDDPSSGSPVAAVGVDPNAPNQHTGAVALALYNASTLALESTVPAPLIPYGGVSHPSIPVYVFYDASGTTRYELVGVGEGASAVWAVASF